MHEIEFTEIESQKSESDCNSETYFVGAFSYANCTSGCPPPLGQGLLESRAALLRERSKPTASGITTDADNRCTYVAPAAAQQRNGSTHTLSKQHVFNMSDESMSSTEDDASFTDDDIAPKGDIDELRRVAKRKLGLHVVGG